MPIPGRKGGRPRKDTWNTWNKSKNRSQKKKQKRNENENLNEDKNAIDSDYGFILLL